MVDLVLETSISVTAGTLRVTAQLIDGRSDEHVWAGTYAWPAADLAAAQDEAAKRIAREIDVRLARRQQVPRP